MTESAQTKTLRLVETAADVVRADLDTRRTALTSDPVPMSVLLLAGEFIDAFARCGPDVQESVREMLKIVVAPDADTDERDMARLTISEALFPVHHEGELGVELGHLDELAIEHQPDGASARAELDAEEVEFSSRLKAAIDQSGLTQGELAARAGVGQPAISMMLSRHCRPQRRTVQKLAAALNVPAAELWPNS